MAVSYLRSTTYSAIPVWTTGAKVAGTLVRQTAPAINSERVFVCTIAGSSGASEPTWVTTKGAKTVDSTVTWQEITGIPGVNGDVTNTSSATGVRSTNPGLGRIIKNDTVTHLFIASVSGTTSFSTPFFNTGTGSTTTDGSTTWICIGPISAFPSWTAPHARLGGAMSTVMMAAGDDCYVADDHNETQNVAINTALQGTIAAACNAWCISRTAASPPTAADLRSDPYNNSATPDCARVTTTGNFGLQYTGANANLYGIAFICASGGTTGALSLTMAFRGKLERCSLRQMSTGNAGIITLPHGDSVDCSFAFNGPNSSISNNSPGKLRLIKATGSTILNFTGVLPNPFIAAQNGEVILDGLDLSAQTAGTIVSGRSVVVRAVVSNCKINPSVTLGTSPTDRVHITDFIACDAGSSVLQHARYRYEGTQSVSSVFRPGGSTDGTTPYSWEIITSANSKWLQPFESMPISIWNDRIGVPVTLTIYAQWSVGRLPYIDEVWIEVEYYGDASSTIATIINNTKATYLTPQGVQHPIDNTLWTGLSSTTFSMPITFTPQIVGYITVRVKMARIGTQHFIDRRPVLS